MPNRELSRRVGPDLLLVAGVLALILGLGILTAGLLAAEPSLAPGDVASPRARIARAARATPTRLNCRCAHPTIEPVSHLAQPIPWSPDMAGGPSGSGVAPDYLTRMTTLLRRRAPSGPMSDPYQASLNPAVYGVAETAPTDHAAGSPSDP